MIAKGLPRYPWDKWFAKAKFTLKRGKDFACQTHGMVAQIRNKAAKEKIRMNIVVTDADTITVTQRG